ncbi:Stage II sporulation protein M [uncultured archaeon]|nr:Stage II sporulation protein M [uncultured archaeon]
MKKAKKSVRKNFIAEQYRKSWNFIKESKKYIWASVFIFFLFVLIGFFIPIPDTLKNSLFDMLKNILGQVKDLSWFGMIKFIFLNNLQSSFLGMILGVFFGVFPVVIAVINGYVLGFVASIAVGSGGIGSLWRIFPHGIFELPAVFISLGLGIKLSTFILKKKKFDSLKEFFWEGLRVFLFVIIPLLIIAAIIEGSLIFLLK